VLDGDGRQHKLYFLAPGVARFAEAEYGC
jgi:hypothetical protein